MPNNTLWTWENDSERSGTIQNGYKFMITPKYILEDHTSSEDMSEPSGTFQTHSKLIKTFQNASEHPHNAKQSFIISRIFSEQTKTV